MASSSSSSSRSPSHLTNPSLTPVTIVTKASQLPAEFLVPSPSSKLVIGFDNEGVELGRHGRLCVMQLAFPDAIYLLDAVRGGKDLIKACKPALESEHITKVIHDCKRDSEALFYQFDIKLNNVVDTQIAYSLIESQEKGRRVNPYISFVKLLADPRYCGVSYTEKKEVKENLQKNPRFWEERPITDFKKRNAAQDVRFLIHIYKRMMEKLNERSLWYLAVRGALYCRCFCARFDEWPALPPVPEALKHVDGNGPERETIRVFDVPAGSMGSVMGTGGKRIKQLRESCEAELHVGGSLPDRVFIIGTEKEATIAEARIQDVLRDARE